MTCPKCGSQLAAAASECSACGMPTVFMGGDDRVAASGPVLEPEVFESLEDVGRPGAAGAEARDAQVHVRPVGCTLGPGCGCLGLPLMALAGVVVSSVIALLWLLSLGRVPLSLVRLAKQARRGSTRS